MDAANIVKEGKTKERTDWSANQLEQAIQYFQERGVKTLAIIPRGFVEQKPRDGSKEDPMMLSDDVETLRRLRQEGHLSAIRIKDDDNVAIYMAMEKDAYILSNDNYRDNSGRYPERKKFLEERVINFDFILGKFLPDPEHDFIELINGIRRRR